MSEELQMSEGQWVSVDGYDTIAQVESSSIVHGSEVVVLDNGDDLDVVDLTPLTPHPVEDPSWFRDEAGERWFGKVGDGSITVTLYDDELATLPTPPRPLRVEVYTKVVHLGGGPLERRDYRWRIRHTSNGEIIAHGEGYVDKRDRDHAVALLHPDLDVVEVEG